MKKFILSASLLLALPVFGVESTDVTQYQEINSGRKSASEDNIQSDFMENVKKLYGKWKKNAFDFHYLGKGSNFLFQSEYGLLPELEDFERIERALIEQLGNFSETDPVSAKDFDNNRVKKTINISNFVKNYKNKNCEKMSTKECRALENYSNHQNLSQVLKDFIEMEKAYRQLLSEVSHSLEKNFPLGLLSEVSYSLEKNFSLGNSFLGNFLDEKDAETTSNFLVFFEERIDQLNDFTGRFFTELFQEFPEFPEFPGISLFAEPKDKDNSIQGA